MTNDKAAPNDGKFHVRISLEDVFGYVDRRKSGTYAFKKQMRITEHSEGYVLIHTFAPEAAAGAARTAVDAANDAVKRPLLNDLSR